MARLRDIHRLDFHSFNLDEFIFGELDIIASGFHGVVRHHRKFGNCLFLLKYFKLLALDGGKILFRSPDSSIEDNHKKSCSASWKVGLIFPFSSSENGSVITLPSLTALHRKLMIINFSEHEP